MAVTARIQTIQFFGIDLNMRPFSSRAIHSYLDGCTAVRFDLCQSSGSPPASYDARFAVIIAGLFIVALSG